MKKKTRVILSALLLMSVMMAACGKKEEEKSPLIGTWNAVSVETAGVKVEFETFVKQSGEDIKMSISFSEDKKFKMEAMGTEVNGTWEEKDGTVTADSDGETQTFKLEDKQLIYEDSAKGNITFIFEK